MFGIDLVSIIASGLAAFIPAGIDIIKGAANRWIGGGAQAQPSNFQEMIEWERLGIDKLKALAALDAAGPNISKWVANLRAAERSIIALIIILIWAVIAILSLWVAVSDNILQWIGTMASSVMFFLFGDKVNMTFKQGNR